MNKFELFMNKISNMPLYIKQLVYKKLACEMKNFECADIGENFSSYCPILTFKGETELIQKTNGFDGNIYNFLEFTRKGFSIAEISINTFLTMEETAKIFVFCAEENLVDIPEKNTFAVAQYLSGKIRLGEYLVLTDKISDEQLNIATDKCEVTEKKFGEILIELGYLTSNDIKSVLTLKNEAQKRFVLDCDTVPITQTVCTSDESRMKDEISKLKSENNKLKAQLNKLLELVK